TQPSGHSSCCSQTATSQESLPSPPTLALISCSTLAPRSSSSSLSSLFSFSSFCLTLWRLSSCSPSSATPSACFLRSAAAVASCRSVASSRSLLRRCSSASRFLLSSS
ncbi:hypothetical protein N310_01668, partial [Acanthisitta chloris]